MDQFESNLFKATNSNPPSILGAIAAVVDRNGYLWSLVTIIAYWILLGTIIYHHASGFQSLDANAPVLDKDSTFALGSAGKFITHVAALQCVERGLIDLDEPVYPHLPELEGLEIISTSDGNDNSDTPFQFRMPRSKISLRYLLNHSSGIGYHSHPLLSKWRGSASEEQKAKYQQLDPYFSAPLLFEPGEGWEYGASIQWTGVLVSRLTNQSLGEYIQENVFDPLGMKSSTYSPREQPDIRSRLLRTVRRENDTIMQSDYDFGAPISNASDIMAILADLISSKPKLLNRSTADLFFVPQFTPSSLALANLREGTENYAACAGIPGTMKHPRVNYAFSGLFVEEELQLSGMPARTVTWNGMPNVIWALNMEKGLGMIFATQLLPVDDKKTIDLAMSFFMNAWKGAHD
jgi:CubicO group peptidase (beta-lactamase class C family)